MKSKCCHNDHLSSLFKVKAKAYLAAVVAIATVLELMFLGKIKVVTIAILKELGK